MYEIREFLMVSAIINLLFYVDNIRNYPLKNDHFYGHGTNEKLFNILCRYYKWLMVEIIMFQIKIIYLIYNVFKMYQLYFNYVQISTYLYLYQKWEGVSAEKSAFCVACGANRYPASRQKRRWWRRRASPGLRATIGLCHNRGKLNSIYHPLRNRRILTRMWMRTVDATAAQQTHWGVIYRSL